MMTGDNNLTFAQANRLAMLINVLGWMIRAIADVLRHGYESRNTASIVTRRETLEQSCNSTIRAIAELIDAGDVRADTLLDACAQLCAKAVQRAQGAT